LSEHVLVITEKTSSARKIAQALDDLEKPKISREKGVPFFISKRGNKTIIIVSAVGHIYGIAQKKAGWFYPIYDINWIPLHQIDKTKKHLRHYIEIIKQLSQKATEFVSACDNDNEGSLIAFNILLHACGEKSLDKTKRMRYNTLIKKDLLNAWENCEKLDFLNINAGKARHEIDWLFGINFSRAMTIAFTNTSKERKILSIGRVQGPTLKFIFDKKAQIDRFIPIPYWKILAETTINGEIFPLQYSHTCANKLDEEVKVKELVKKCSRKEGKIFNIEESKQSILPPSPFNIGDLQKEAYKKLKIMPTNTLKIAETLYLSAYISYPRTNSQKLPDNINISGILSNLKLNNNYKYIVKDIEKKNLKPNQGRKDDAAHPAIYPTEIKPWNLGKMETKVYDLICKRFLACFGEPSIHQNLVAYVNFNEYHFSLKGKKITQNGWMYYYFPYINFKEQILPPIYIGMKIPLTKLITRRNYSKKTSRYNQSSLLRLMEEQGIGTKTSRSNIIDTLFRRGYVTGNPIRITKLGYVVIQTLQEYSPLILSTQLTKNLENQLDKVQEGKIESVTIVKDTIKTIKPLINQFKDNETKIGAQLYNFLSDNNKEIYDNGCKICGRQKSENKIYCNVHMMVYNNIEKKYITWKKALKVSWTEYMKKLSTLPNTGRIVKEVCQDILDQN
jgi:DNA topoisomerase-1